MYIYIYLSRKQCKVYISYITIMGTTTSTCKNEEIFNIIDFRESELFMKYKYTTVGKYMNVGTYDDVTIII